MAPKSRDYSIVGDEQERHRIQLEQNLQTNNELSLHLSSNYSVEYPRHAAHSPPFAMASFNHHSADDQSAIQHWSYRTVDDDDDNGVNPYPSLSTTNHHASALTFTAGLTGRGRDHTQSGVEYDPDRPLHNMIAGVDSRLSMFQSKSNPIFDPLVVDGDDTEQLDRVLNTGRHAPHILRSPLASSSSSSSSSSPRPKLSDALHNVAFSPKRPRSVQPFVSPRAPRNPSRRPVSPSPGKVNFDVPTPRPRAKASSQFSLSVPSSDNNSKFTKLARGIAREIESEQKRVARMEEETAHKPRMTKGTLILLLLN